MSHDVNKTWLSRRRFMQGAGLMAAGAAASPLFGRQARAASVEEEVRFAGGLRELVQYPQKRPLIRDHPAAASGNAVRGLQPRRHHAQRCFLRALPPGEYSLVD